MKRVYLIVFNLFLASFSMASQAHQSMVCMSETHELRYVENSAGGGDYVIAELRENIPSLTQSFVAFSSKGKSYNPEKLASAQVVFEKISSIRLGAVQTSDEGSAILRQWRTRQGLKFVKVTREARESLGVMAGDLMTFYCDESTVSK